MVGLQKGMDGKGSKSKISFLQGKAASPERTIANPQCMKKTCMKIVM